MMMDVRRSLFKRLIICGGCVFGGTVFPPLLAGNPVTWEILATTFASSFAGITMGNAASTIDALTQGKDSDTVSLDNQDLTEDNSLTQAVGKAIASVITLAAKQQRGKTRQYLEKIAAQAKDNWIEIAQQELAKENYPQLYAGFVESMYEWKETAFAVTEEDKEQLNAALGELSNTYLSGKNFVAS